MPEITDERLKELEASFESATANASKLTRLELESKKFKERAQSAEEKLTEAEKAKLKANGDLEELLRVEREENKKLADTIKTRTNTALAEKLRAEVSKFAKDAHDVDALLKASAARELIKLNDEDMSVEGVEDFVKKTREEQAYLFKKKIIEEDGTNGTKGSTDDGKTGQEKYFAELDAAESTKELEAIKKRYGKA